MFQQHSHLFLQAANQHTYNTRYATKMNLDQK
jgi:hypothetical protein